MKLDFPFSPLPKEIWTCGIDLSQAEFRLLGWLCCWLKYGEAQIKVADYQMLSGFTDLKGRHYPPVGLSKNSLKAARESLVERELMVCEQLESGGGRGNKSGWVYSVNLSDSDTFTVNQSDSDPKPVKVSPQTCQGLTLNVSEIDPVIRNKRSTEEPEGSESSFSLRSKEGIEVKPSTKEKKEAKSKADPRHQEVKVAIEGCWTLANPGAAALPWNGREAGALGQVLRSNPSWPAFDLVKCVQNRFASDVNNAERPGVWIPKLTDYFGGPLDRFNKPYGQQKSNAELRQQRNRENIVRAHYGTSDPVSVPRPGGFPNGQRSEHHGGLILEGNLGGPPTRKD